MRFYCSQGGKFLYQTDEILRYGKSPLICRAVTLLYSGYSESEIKSKLSDTFSSEKIEQVIFNLKIHHQKFKKDSSDPRFDNNELAQRLERIFIEKNLTDKIVLCPLNGWKKSLNLPLQDSTPICPMILWPDRIQIGPVLHSSLALQNYADFRFPRFVLDVVKEELQLPLHINYLSESQLQSIANFIAAEISDSFDVSKKKTLREGLKCFNFIEDKVSFFENKWNFHRSRSPQLVDRHYQAERLTSELNDRIVYKDGGYRTSDPDKVLQTLKPVMEGPLGIAKIIKENFTAEKDSAFNTFYVATQALVSDDEPTTIQIECSAHGKGQTTLQRRLSGFAELFERHQAGVMNSLPVLKVRFEDIKEKALSAGSDETEYWVPAFCLVTEDTFWLPASECVKNFHSETKRYEYEKYLRSSNGFAGGATKSEAFVQAVLELIERDHASIWWYNKLVMPEIELSGFDSTYLAETIKTLHTQGKNLKALDLTMDFGVHVVAMILENAGAISSIGLGAHLDIELAVSRALSECVQLQQVPGKLKNCLQRVNALPEEDKRYLKLCTSKKSKNHFGTYNPEGISSVLTEIIQNFKKNKFNLLYQNYSLKELNDFFVVRAIAPGLACLSQPNSARRHPQNTGHALNEILFEI